MSYRLKEKESVPDGIRRVVGEEIESAVAQLGGSARNGRDVAIHEARKSVKKIRGVLRLLRDELGPAYRQENGRFRAIGHTLSELRDAGALLEVFDGLVAKKKSSLGSSATRKIRRGLEHEKKRIEEQLDVARVASRASSVFARAKQRLARWPLERDGFTALRPGLRATYRRGRKALDKARKTGDALDFHDFRKRVKDHWYHVRLLESTWTEVMQAHEASLKELETWLGDDHNLVLLREKLEARPGDFGGKQIVAGFLEFVQSQEEELRKNSISLGERVYGEKPRAFVRGIEILWEAWQQQPETMKAVEKSQRHDPPRKGPKSVASNTAELQRHAG